VVVVQQELKVPQDIQEHRVLVEQEVHKVKEVVQDIQEHRVLVEQEVHKVQEVV
jgi:hypothetical protein